MVCCGYRVRRRSWVVGRLYKGGKRRALEILIEREPLLDRRMIIVDTLIHARFRIRRHPALEKVGFPLQRDILHEIKRVGVIVYFFVSECDQETVGDEPNVLTHEFLVHADERAREGVGQEFAFEVDGFLDDSFDSLRVRTTFEVGEEETGKVGVEAFVSGDELVGKGEPGHEASFLEPEDGCLGEGSRG